MQISEILKHICAEGIKKSFPDLAWQEDFNEVTESTQEKFGHYQCNSAMRLAKPLGKSPRDIANSIIQNIETHYENKKLIEKLEVAGPGFINITLSPEFLSYCLNNNVNDERLSIPLPNFPKRIVIDFSSPNIAKEMHVGHLRSTIIGDCLARLFAFLGDNVIALNHVGDWGTAFGMLIAYMKKNVPDVLEGKEKTDLPTLMHWYRESKKQLDQDEVFKKEARLEVVKLQSGDPQSLKAWQMICDISRKAYKEIYDLLDVKIVERGESFYNPFLPTIVKELEDKGLVTISDGAKCIFLEGFENREKEPLPLMIQKSDGGYNYDTTDMAAMWHRVLFEKADRIIIVTDAGQGLHFQLVYQASVKAGYLNPNKVRFDHVPFGLVLGPDGKKFKTRSGDTEKLIDLLIAAIERAKVILKEKDPELSDVEVQRIGRILGIGAVKYADLACNRIGDYVFSYDRMLKFEGNTAAFLMYSYVRIAGIKRRIAYTEMHDIISQPSIALEHPSEVQLGLHLLKFHEILILVSEDLLPNHLTEYLYQLAQKFNAFFRDCRVEGSKEQLSRLQLCELVRRTLEIGFNILGLQTVEKM